MTAADPEACVFCRIASGQLTPEVVAFSDDATVAFPALHQQARNRGHTLVISRQHVAQIYDVGDDLAGPLMSTVVRVARAVKTAFAADGVTIRQNNDKHGGQDIFHVHFHVVPRYARDSFDLGDERFPFGAKEVPLAERVEQARQLALALRG